MERVWGLILAVVTVAAYARVLHGELEFDDQKLLLLLAEPALPPGGPLAWLAELTRGGRPATNLTFRLNLALGGLDPFGFHVVNLLLHLATTGAVFVLGSVLARRAGLGRPSFAALVAASLFALHPIQTGAVSYVSQRAEVLASLAYALTCLAALWWARADRPRDRLARGGLAVLLCVLALASKSVTLTLPAAVALVFWAVPGRADVEDPGPSRRWPLVLALFFVAGIWLVRALWQLGPARGSREVGLGVEGLTPWSYFLTQLRVIPTYLRLLVWPAGQNVDWDIAPSTGLLSPPATAAGGLLVVSLAAGGAWLWWRAARWPDERRGAARLAAFGMAWFFLLLAPTSSFMPLVDVAFEHRLYLASWGLFLGVGALVEHTSTRLTGTRARHAAAAGALLLVALAVATTVRNGVWESGLALWGDSVAKSPGKSRPWMSLGSALGRASRMEEALVALDRALALATTREATVEAAQRKAAVLTALGRSPEAVAVLTAMRERYPEDGKIALDLAIALVNAGRLDEAERITTLLVRQAPGMAEAHAALGSIALRRGGDRDAVEAFERAVRLDPNHGGLRFNLGIALERTGRRADACAQWTAAKTLPLPPDVATRVLRLLDGPCRGGVDGPR